MARGTYQNLRRCLNMNENRLNVLLTEYTACLNDVSQLDSDIWQSSYVFLGISIAGYTILIQFQVNNWYELGVSCVVAILGVSLLIVWDKLCSEWLKIIQINLHRMREIEKELCMWRERYIYYLRSDMGAADSLSVEEMNFLKKLDEINIVKDQRLIGPPSIRRVLRYVKIIIIMGWVIANIKQTIFLVLGG